MASRCFGWAGFQMLRFASMTAPFLSPATAHDGGTIIWPRENSGSQEAGGHSLPVNLSITHKCLGDWRACYASIARLPQRSRDGSRTAPARRTEALRGRWHPALPLSF